jgi:hypothetical protein
VIANSIAGSAATAPAFLLNPARFTGKTMTDRAFSENNRGLAVNRDSNESPYLTNPNRLADVLAAIQTMGTYRFYKLDFEGWADRISGDTKWAEHWRTVFVQHPEFFRIDRTGTKASLVWRRQHPKLFHVDEDRKLSKQQFLDLSPEQKQRVSRIALSAGDIQSLLKTAIDLHARAVEQQRERRWWMPLMTALAALFGSLFGATLRA